MIIPATLRRQVIERAGNRCEYCGLAQAGQEAAFRIDHVVPAIVGGNTSLENLALACVSCSLAQGRSPARARPAHARGGRAFSSAARLVASAFPLGRRASCGCHTDGTRNGRGAQHESPASVGAPRGGSASRKASAASAYVSSNRVFQHSSPNRRPQPIHE
jgi:hypothetical protein